MTHTEWAVCDEPDLMLEEVMGKISRGQLVTFVCECWRRIAPHIKEVPLDYTVVDQFVEQADRLNDHDAVVYAAEAALKAAGLAPNLREEQRHQAELLRRIVGDRLPTLTEKR